MFMFHLGTSSALVDAVSAEPSAADQRRAARARVERQMAVLDRLAEIGLEIAEEAGRRAAAPAGDDPQPDPGLLYSRAARAVRLTIALQARLAKDLVGLGRTEGDARRNRVHRLVTRAIRREHDDADEIEQLSDEAWERLREHEALDDVETRPVNEIVARIAKDLGLSPDWSGFTEVFGPELFWNAEADTAMHGPDDDHVGPPGCRGAPPNPSGAARTGPDIAVAASAGTGPGP